ncbi:TIGR02646 family protein [Vibrio parahaemolyticus]|nr:TIGR02646 family protein [Vibrio parahaemolyticus]
MKKITKTHQPARLRDWREANKNIDHSYDALKGKPAHKALKTQLIIEQGYLCAYTGRRIDNTSCHVEHLKPQTSCEGWEDVEYRNMVACFPENGGDTSHGYGAPIKAGWWNEREFVSPLTEECERRFAFVWSGKIKANPADNEAAKKNN